MKTVLAFALLLTSISAFAGGGSSGSMTCYSKDNKTVVYFQSDIRFFQQNEVVSVGHNLNGTNMNEDMSVLRPDARTYEFTSAANNKITLRQNDLFLEAVTIAANVDGVTQTLPMNCHIR